MVDTEENNQPLETNLDDVEASEMDILVSALQGLAEIVQPVLEKLFSAAEADTDLWLKKKEVKILTDWQLITARQLDALQQMLASQPAKRLWQPGI